LLCFSCYNLYLVGPYLLQFVARFPLLVDFLVTLYIVLERSYTQKVSEVRCIYIPHENYDGSSDSDNGSESDSNLSALTRPHSHVGGPFPASPPPVGLRPPVPRPRVLKSPILPPPTGQLSAYQRSARRLNTVQHAQVPYRTHTPFSLLAPTTWACKETWEYTLPERIPVRPTIHEGLTQTLPRLRHSLVALGTQLATLVYDCLKFQRFVLPALFALEACTAIRQGEPMRYNWLRFPRNARQLKALFCFDRADPVHAPLFDIYDFWYGWIVGLARLAFWRLPRFALRAARDGLRRGAGVDGERVRGRARHGGGVR